MARHRRRQYWVTANTVKYSARKWLNPASYVQSNSSQGGWVITSLRATKGEQWGMDANLRIGDCSRWISLDVTFHNPTEQRKVLVKMNALIAELDQLRKKMIAVKFKKESETDCDG